MHQCKNCHGSSAGPEPIGPKARLLNRDYAYADGTANQLAQWPVAAGGGSGSLLFDIVPGDLENSILTFRLESTLAQVKMPDVSKSIAHDEGVALVSEWIASLPGSCP